MKLLLAAILCSFTTFVSAQAIFEIKEIEHYRPNGSVVEEILTTRLIGVAHSIRCLID